MIVDNGVLEKKCQTPGKKKYILELEKQFKAPTVMWFPGPLVFYSFSVVLWSLGTLVLWYDMRFYDALCFIECQDAAMQILQKCELVGSCWFQVLQIPCEWIPCKWDSYCHSPTLQIPCKMRCKLIRGFNLNNTNTSTITTSRKGTSSSNSKLCPNASLYSDQPQNVTSPATKSNYF